MRRLSEPARPAAKASSTSETSATGSFKSPGLEARLLRLAHFRINGTFFIAWESFISAEDYVSPVGESFVSPETTFPPRGNPLFSRRTTFSTQRGIFHLPRNCFSPRGNPLFRKTSLLSACEIVCSCAQTLCPQGEFLRPVMKKDFPMGKSFAPIGRKP